ncbi:carboxypeptidase-like regulatory domain-containing protein [Bremerella sp. P1]|uniref:carboxypeptidase-like regulatory domain-containing protein n=1 Tax=Bremerella sp. P1 TaxID=3026424 RepID=UPI0023682BC7|nr:carboxypeptidase-like regulatory domain-containing protein [Bremerella sp. P1]WDI41605.1 carboxypeptidase-like regulatory domain-containing protein [Bremerella sp. P1]
MFRKHYLCAPVIGICIGVLGCSASSPSNVSEVQGTVTVDGQPIPDALVTFKPRHSGKNSFGRTDTSGHYSLVYSTDLTGAEIGEHDVTISNKPFPGHAIPKVLIPTKFGKPGTLTANVAGGTSNEIDFAMNSKR